MFVIISAKAQYKESTVMKIKQNKINLRIVASMKTRQELPAGLLFFTPLTCFFSAGA